MAELRGQFGEERYDRPFMTDRHCRMNQRTDRGRLVSRRFSGFAVAVGSSFSTFHTLELLAVLSLFNFLLEVEVALCLLSQHSQQRALARGCDEQLSDL